MPRRFLTDEAKAAFNETVRAVEGASAAELVVAVRARSGSYFHADLLAGLLAALAALAFLLFSPWPFDLAWFVVDPIVAGLLAGLASSRLPSVRRALTLPAARRRRVEAAARATFVEKRVHATAGRTGILLYLSLLEREAAVVVDLAVEPLAATDAWRDRVESIRQALRRGADGAEAARRARGLAGLLAPALARQAGDRDELPNEVSL
jgi:putative membrane protein